MAISSCIRDGEGDEAAVGGEDQRLLSKVGVSGPGEHVGDAGWAATNKVAWMAMARCLLSGSVVWYLVMVAFMCSPKKGLLSRMQLLGGSVTTPVSMSDGVSEPSEIPALGA